MENTSNLDLLDQLDSKKKVLKALIQLFAMSDHSSTYYSDISFALNEVFFECDKLVTELVTRFDAQK